MILWYYYAETQRGLIASCEKGLYVHVLLLAKLVYIPSVPKMYLTFTLYFEAVTIIMLGILGFPVSSDLYNSFDTLLICFHNLMNKWK